MYKFELILRKEKKILPKLSLSETFQPAPTLPHLRVSSYLWNTLGRHCGLVEENPAKVISIRDHHILSSTLPTLPPSPTLG